MKYLDKAPFSSKPATSAYRDGWESTFGKKAKVLRRPEGVMWWLCPAHKRMFCEMCAWLDGPVEVEQAGKL